MNIFVNIPVPAANGSGAPVNMSQFGLSKTISVAGPYIASVTIEISNEEVPTSWAPIVTYNNPDGDTFDVACLWMRATVKGYKSGAPTCDVGGPNTGTLFASLPVPATPGPGAAVDTSLLGLFKTVTVGGSGGIQIEVSEDGVSDWSQIALGFQSPGHASNTLAARFMRAVRTAVLGPLPIVNVAACSIGDADGPTPWPANPPVLITKFVRLTGSDITGNGTLANPYRTVQHAYDTIPLYIPPGVRYVVDCTGITETFPAGYTMPAFHSACSVDLGPAPEDPLSRRRAGVKTRADLQKFSGIPSVDCDIIGADGVLSQDPVDRLFTFTLNVPRPSWATVVAGTGDSFAVVGGLVTLTDAAGTFTAAMIGNEITIAGSTTPANDGTYLVQSFVGPTQIRYVNVAAVAEAFPGTWSVQIGALNGQIWRASNATSLGDARIVYSTQSKVVLTVGGVVGSQTPTFPVTIMEETATFQGNSPPFASGLTIAGSFNISNCDSFFFIGIRFINLDGPAAPCMGIRVGDASIYGFAYCTFSTALIHQGVSAYRQIFEFCRMHGGWFWEPSGAGLTINASLFDRITGVGTTPNAGYMTIQNSVWQLSTRPLGEFRPLDGGNFGVPVNPAGGGLQLWARNVRVQNIPPNVVAGVTGGAGMLLNAGGEINQTTVVSCATNAVVVPKSIGPIAATGISGGNNTGIGMVLTNHSTVDRKVATNVTGLLGDYKIGANAIAPAGSWAGLTRDNDIAAGPLLSEMCMIYTSP